MWVSYLAGRQSSSTVDVSVKVKGCFRHAPKGKKDAHRFGLSRRFYSHKRHFESSHFVPALSFHTAVLEVLRLCVWACACVWPEAAVGEWLTNTCSRKICLVHRRKCSHNSLMGSKAFVFSKVYVCERLTVKGPNSRPVFKNEASVLPTSQKDIRKRNTQAVCGLWP